MFWPGKIHACQVLTCLFVFLLTIQNVNLSSLPGKSCQETITMCNGKEETRNLIGLALTRLSFVFWGRGDPPPPFTSIRAMRMTLGR